MCGKLNDCEKGELVKMDFRQKVWQKIGVNEKVQSNFSDEKVDKVEVSFSKLA